MNDNKYIDVFPDYSSLKFCDMLSTYTIRLAEGIIHCSGNANVVPYIDQTCHIQMRRGLGSMMDCN